MEVVAHIQLRLDKMKDLIEELEISAEEAEPMLDEIYEIERLMEGE